MALHTGGSAGVCGAMGNAMSQSLRQEPATRRSSFIQACAYCGAHFEVAVSHEPAPMHRHRYACPECGKSYAIQGAAPPDVSLLSTRTDGKGEGYQETIF